MAPRETDYSGFRKTVIRDSEIASVEALRARLALLPPAIARWNQVAKIRPKRGSQLALDDAVCGWRQVSHGLSHQLNHAADTLHALTVLIPPTGLLTVPYVAHYPLARSALEAASLALWILAPEDPKTRIERHIRNAWREVSADAEMRAIILKAAAAEPSMGLTSMLDKGRKDTKAWKSKHVAQIRECATRIGVADPTLSDRTIGFAEIVREAATEVGVRGVFGELVWREISGLSHPSMMRSVFSQDVEEIEDHGDGTIHALFTSDISRIKYSVEAAFTAFGTAVDLFGRRKIQPGDPHRYAA